MHAIDEFVVADRRRRFGASYISVNSVMGTDSVGHISLTTTMTPPNRKNNSAPRLLCNRSRRFFSSTRLRSHFQFQLFQLPFVPYDQQRLAWCAQQVEKLTVIGAKRTHCSVCQKCDRPAAADGIRTIGSRILLCRVSRSSRIFATDRPFRRKSRAPPARRDPRANTAAP